MRPSRQFQLAILIWRSVSVQRLWQPQDGVALFLVPLTRFFFIFKTRFEWVFPRLPFLICRNFTTAGIPFSLMLYWGYFRNSEEESGFSWPHPSKRMAKWIEPYLLLYFISITWSICYIVFSNCLNCETEIFRKF